jgi:hypothetical protein
MKNRNTIFSAILFVFALLCTAVAPKAFGVVPAPDGGYPGGNTAAGQAALLSLTSGTYNTAVGVFSLRSDTEGNFNTGVGAGTLLLNTGEQNTATGAGALLSNAFGFGNTANGAFALFNNTNGPSNTATGLYALFANTTGANNVAVGNSSLEDNTTGFANTALGFTALANNIAANGNTATGAGALYSNTNGGQNTANGYAALYSNITGATNTANGVFALANNTDGDQNTAVGSDALSANISGYNNTAVGFSALADTTGYSNTAVGYQALHNNTTGTFNVALGNAAGLLLTTGSGNVYIGTSGEGVAAEDNHTYIRNINMTSVSGGGTDGVTVNLTTGLLGHSSSSRRYKEDIEAMDHASQALFALKPVTFRYKKEIDRSQSLQYGLVAEDVADVDPNLAIRDGNGQIESVRYSAINAMLLNEFLKDHKRVEEQQACITELNSRAEKQDKIIAQQQEGIAALTAQLKDQAAQIQRVSARVEMSKATSNVVLNRP